MNEPLPSSGTRWAPAILTSVIVGLIVAGGLCALADRQFAEVNAAIGREADARTKLAARVDALQSNVEMISGQPKADTDAIATQFNDANSKLGALSDRVAALEKKPEPAPVPPPPPPAPAAAPAPAADSAALKLAVTSGKPFTGELAAWQKQHPKVDVTPLAATAQSGIPTDAEMNTRLREALDDAVHIKKAEDTGFVGQMNAHLAGLVSIKRSADAGPYARLRTDVMRDDVDTLMAEIERLNDEDRKPLADWLTTAHARRDALAALNKLDTAGVD